jgi:type IV pilus assembly protein PilW
MVIKKFIRSKQFTPDCNKGFTLLELLIALVIASIILGASLLFIVDQRKLFVEDQSRTQVNQNLRAALDLIGTDIKQTGELLAKDTRLPVVQVINSGASGTPDQLVLQRKPYDLTELPVCSTVSGSTSTIDVSFNPANAVCPFSDGNGNSFPDNLDQWQTTRCSKDGNTTCDRAPNATNDSCVEQGGTDNECLWAYIYNPSTQQGEFFLYAYEDSVSGTPTRYRLHRAQSATPAKNNWANTYTYTAPTVANPNPTNPIVYILEERRYRLNTSDGVLELILNQQTTAPNTPIRLVNQLSNFKVLATVITDPSTGATADQTTFPVTGPPAYTWRQLQSVKVNLTATNPSSGAINVPNLSLSAQYFPRNAASK